MPFRIKDVFKRGPQKEIDNLVFSLIEKSKTLAKEDCLLLFPVSGYEGNYIHYVIRFAIYANHAKQILKNHLNTEEASQLLNHFKHALEYRFANLVNVEYGNDGVQALVPTLSYINDVTKTLHSDDYLYPDEYYERLLLLLLDGECDYTSELLASHDQTLLDSHVAAIDSSLGEITVASISVANDFNKWT